MYITIVSRISSDLDEHIALRLHTALAKISRWKLAAFGHASTFIYRRHLSPCMPLVPKLLEKGITKRIIPIYISRKHD